MECFDKLIWTFNSKGYDIKLNQDEEGKLSTLQLFMDERDLGNWTNLLNRLNKVYNDFYRYSIVKQNICEVDKFVLKLTFDANNIEDEKFQKQIDVLNYAVAQDEYKGVSYRHDGSTFDIKLGISCNNNCVHCVVKPRIFEVQRKNPEEVVLDSGFGMHCSKDLSFEQVINILSNEMKNVHGVVLTGGEPTLRKDFLQIVKWLYYNKPYIKVYIQSNGRNFSDKNLVRALRRYTREIYIAVAIHGTEETHNKIVNNRKEKGNPYQETIDGIKNILEFFNPEDIRSEMVLSRYNVNNVMESVKFQYEELGLKHIGISYPHLDGFDENYINDVAPAMPDVLKLMKELNEYLKDKNDLLVMIEEVPACIYNQIDGEIRIRSFGFSREKVIMNFMGDQTDEFVNFWALDHAKFEKCKECCLNDNCVGGWKETVRLNEQHIQPIKNINKSFNKFLKDHNWGFNCKTC